MNWANLLPNFCDSIIRTSLGLYLVFWTDKSLSYLLAVLVLELILTVMPFAYFGELGRGFGISVNESIINNTPTQHTPINTHAHIHAHSLYLVHSHTTTHAYTHSRTILGMCDICKSIVISIFNCTIRPPLCGMRL